MELCHFHTPNIFR